MDVVRPYVAFLFDEIFLDVSYDLFRAQAFFDQSDYFLFEGLLIFRSQPIVKENLVVVVKVLLRKLAKNRTHRALVLLLHFHISAGAQPR